MRKGLARFCTASVSDMAQRRERTASNSRQQYDTVSKILIHQNPEDWLQFSLGIPEAEVIEVLETEQLTVKSNRADSFIRVNVHGKEVIVHLEMQTHDSRADYLTDLAILSGLIFDYATIRETITEAIMQESSVIQHFLQQGTRENLIEGILENLEVRFNARDLQAVASTLQRINAVQRLKQLRREALQTPTLEAFEQTLGGLAEEVDDNGSP